MTEINKTRRTAVIINLKAIKYNLKEIRKKVGNFIKICAVVKADAYGHGVKKVAKFIEEEKLADYFAVATAIEGKELRDNYIKLPILILGLIMPDEVENAIKSDLSLTVSDQILIDRIDATAAMINKRVKIHLKIDTGMGRIGCRPEEAPILAKYITTKKNLIFEGIFSHFSDSELCDKSYSKHQLNVFNDCLEKIKAEGVSIPIIHMANSGAILDLPSAYYDMVRSGMIIYGIYPTEEVSRSISLKPAMSLRSEIVFIKKLPKGHYVSYGNTFSTKKDTYIATIPAGYADGIPRALSNNHDVLIEGKFYPIAGRVCMDQFLVDLDDDFYPTGTEVEVFGTKSTPITELAIKVGTIPHEIMVRMKRAKKYYI